MDALIIKGDSIEEAIDSALAVFDASENEVDVQVVDWGEPGVLGIGGRPAAVRVALKSLPSTQASPACVHGNWGTLHRGRIELGRRTAFAAVQGGELILSHPTEGPFPILVPCQGIEVRVNGKLMRAPQQVTKEDDISIKTCQEDISGQWCIELTEDKVQAIIKLQPRGVRNYKLADAPPSRTLRLKVEKEESLFPPLTFSELVEELQRLGIKRGVDWSRCREVTEKAISGDVIIAKGVPATPSQDGFLELFCLTEAKYVTTVDDSENVDFRDRFNINSVVRGAVLAHKHPPQHGENGISVKGEPVLPKPPVDVILKLGKGVELHNDREVVAVEPGRPVITERGRLVSIRVEPVLIHPRNVDIASGNLNFSGHIRILGDVQDGMLVNANEDVVVQGLVSAATVQAGGSAHVWGNVISSTIVAGGPLAIVGDFLGILDELVVEIDRLLGYMKQLRRKATGNSASRVIQLLLQEKCQTIPQLVRDFEQRIEQLPQRLNTRALEEFARQLSVSFAYGSCRISERRELEALLQKCKEWQSAICEASLVKENVRVNCLLNSSLTATGNVTIIGKCNDHSQVHAGGTVSVRGAFRGGEIQANGTVMVGELGAPVGTFTTVRVAAPASVKVGRLHENVLISIGKRAYFSHREETDVHFSYDAQEDKITKTYATVRI